MLYLTARKRHKRVAFEKVENALPVKICDDADVIPEIETFAQVYALIPIVGVVLAEGLEYPQLNPRGVTVFLYRSYNFYGDFSMPLSVSGLDHFAKGALA